MEKNKYKIHCKRETDEGTSELSVLISANKISEAIKEFLETESIKAYFDAGLNISFIIKKL